MSLVLELPEDVETWLQTTARARGMDVNTFAVAAFRDLAQTTGKGKPIDQYLEEQRVKYNLPDDWPHAPRYDMTDEDRKALSV